MFYAHVEKTILMIKLNNSFPVYKFHLVLFLFPPPLFIPLFSM